MGYEYRLHFEGGVPSNADAVLREIGGFEEYDAEYGLYAFRRAAPAGGMPDAWAKLEPTIVHVCVNIEAGFEVLREIQASLVSDPDGVTIEEL